MNIIEFDRDVLYGAMMEAVDLNELKAKDLCEICNKSESTVYKWLSGALTIDPLSIASLHFALMYAKKKVPRSLGRIVNKSRNGAHNWAKRNKENKERAEWVGELSQNQNPFIRTYKNEKVRVRELIRDRLGLDLAAYQSLFKTIKRHDVEGREDFDITAIVDRYISKRKKRELKIKK